MQASRLLRGSPYLGLPKQWPDELGMTKPYQLFYIRNVVNGTEFETKLNCGENFSLFFFPRNVIKKPFVTRNFSYWIEIAAYLWFYMGDATMPYIFFKALFFLLKQLELGNSIKFEMKL